MEVELPDGNRLTLPDGATGADAAAAIGSGLAKAALAVKVNGELRDLSRPLPNSNGAGPSRLEILTDRSGDEALSLIRHDAAHVLAAAVTELYPGVKISIGPPIENGFYYDFDFPEGVSVSEADFERIEAKMREHIAADEPFVREDVPASDGARPLPPGGPGLQGRADRGSDREGRRSDRLALHQRSVHRPVPRSARSVDEADQGVQAPVGCRRVLARRFDQADAHADLRDRVLLPEGPRRLPRARSSRPARATTASSDRSLACSTSPTSRPG